MTILDTDPFGSISALSFPATSDLALTKPQHDSGSPKATLVPRVNLKKRSATVADSSPRSTGLSTVNSAFLSGLFADVAQAQNPPTTATVEESGDPRLHGTQSLKKSRVSITKSISRCGRSFRILEEALDTLRAPPSPTGILDSCQPSRTVLPSNDSLQFQLNCVSGDGSASGSPVFPQLPATVSSTSCSTITRNNSDLQSSVTETASKESYGWFVEMDDDCVEPVTGTNAYAPPSASLAFSALSAPKATNQDAEVEWAKAADTVDDVLGDFF